MILLAHSNRFSRSSLFLFTLLTLKNDEVLGKLTGRIERPKGIELILFDKVTGDGEFCKYTEWHDKFDDLQDAAGLCELKEIAWICCHHGLFLLYKEVNYYASSTDDVFLLSGYRKCFIPQNENKPLGSIRYAADQYYDPELTSFITVARDKYFGGSVLYSVNSKSDRELERNVPVRSFLTVGRSRWTVTTFAGNRFCLTPYQEEPKKTWVCVVPDAEELKRESGMSDLQWTHIERGCAGEEIKIKTCFDYRSGELTNVAVGPYIPPWVGTNNATGDGSTLSPFYGDDNCENFDEIAFLLRLRLTHDFQNMYQYVLPLEKQHSWRTELIDGVFDIASYFIKRSYLKPDFVLQIREYFIYFIEKLVWSKHNGWPERPHLETKLAAFELQKCRDTMEKSDFHFVLVELTIMPIIQDLGIGNSISQARPPFDKKPWLDILMEFVWIIFNFVTIACHRVNEFETNFWIDFMSLMDGMYLSPMVPFWTEIGGRARTYYPLLFGGFDTEVYYDQLASMTHEGFRRPPNFQVYQRPDQTGVGTIAGKSPDVRERNEIVSEEKDPLPKTGKSDGIVSEEKNPPPIGKSDVIVSEEKNPPTIGTE